MVTFLLQTYAGTGVNKASARYNAAHVAVEALRPVIEAELEQRKLERAEQKAKNDAERDNGARNGETNFASDDVAESASFEAIDTQEPLKKKKGKNAKAAPKKVLLCIIWFHS